MNASRLLRFVLAKIEKLSGDPNPQYFPKSIAVQMGGVLPYKWEAYCSTNGRCTVGFPFIQGLGARDVQRYKWGAYCRTNWRCAAVLSPRPVRVGVVIFFSLTTPTPPHPDKPLRPSHPRGLDFGPFRLRLAPFGSVRLRLAPFRVCSGSVSGPFRGCWVGSWWGR